MSESQTASKPLDPQLTDIAKGLGVDTTQQMSPEQLARIEAITLAVGCLNEGKVSYTLFASPDSPAESMKVIESHRLSYASDLDTITKETPLARQSVLWAALKTLSIGLKGTLAVLGQDGTPLVIFDSGKATGVEEKKEKKG